MNFDEIKTFLTIVDSGSLQKTSEILFVSQSTVSNRLQSLEETLGVKLIERNKGQKGLYLTPKGEEFISYAIEIITLDSTINDWSKRLKKDTLRIGTIDSITGPYMKKFYRMLSEEGRFTLDISHHWTDRIFSLIENHQVDVGLVPRLFQSKRVRSTPIFQEELVLVSRDKLAEVVMTEDLDTKKEIFFDWGVQYVSWHHQHFMPDQSPLMNVDITSVLIEALHIEGAWAIVPYSIYYTQRDKHHLHMSTLNSTPPERTCYMAMRNDEHDRRKNMLLEFEEKLKQFVDKHSFLKTV